MTDQARPMIQQAADSEACCDACAVESLPIGPFALAAAPEGAPAVTTHAPLIVLEPDTRPSISRTADRAITQAGLFLSAGFLAAALVAATLPESVRLDLWLPLHLALAGAGGTAIASVLPFFVAALSVAPPIHGIVRGGAIALIAIGAAAASLGMAGGMEPVALAGALAYLAGLGGVAVAAFLPCHTGRRTSRRLVMAAYGAAIAQVAVGVGLVIAMLAGVPPVVEAWAFLKPAHAWLNVFGFLSVVIAATLIHLAPTVAGTRIVPRRSAIVAVVGLATGAPLIALGLALGDDRVARLGALAELLGAIGLVAHGLAVRHDRGTWTTDPGWRRLTSWSLLAAPGWFLVVVAMAASRILWLGAVPDAWSLGTIAAPLALGWVVQVLFGAWSQLLPSIGPGDAAAHARQRTILGQGAAARVGAMNVGVALVAMGGMLDWATAVVIGLTICSGVILTSLTIFVHATRAGRTLGRPRLPVASVSRA